MLSQEFGSVPSDAQEQQDHPAGQLDVPSPRSPSAARLLEMTARETDQWRADARAEADQIVAAAREEAAGLVRAAQGEAATLREDARREAAKTVADAQTQADEAHRAAEGRRSDVESEVARLEQVATEHSDHLRRHLEDVLGRLDAVRAPRSSSDGQTS